MKMNDGGHTRIDGRKSVLSKPQGKVSNKALIGSATYRSAPRSSNLVDNGTQAEGEENKRFQFSNRNSTVSGSSLGLPIKRYARFFHGGEVEYRLVSLQSGYVRRAKLHRNIDDINRKLAKARDAGDAAKVAKLTSLRTRQLDALQSLMLGV